MMKTQKKKVFTKKRTRGGKIPQGRTLSTKDNYFGSVKKGWKLSEKDKEKVKKIRSAPGKSQK